MKIAVIVSIALATVSLAPIAFGQTSSLSSAELAERTIHRRAVEAVIWAMPAVNYDLMLQEALKAGARENEIVYWGKPSDWHNQTLTPNPDAIYLMTFYNTRDVGPVVVEVPPAGEDGSPTANIDDLWQMPLEDAGPAGADKGQGATYLILPPGYGGKVPDGYIELRPPTYAGYALLRSTLKSHAQTDVERSVAYGKRINIYPLSTAANPPPTRFTDVKDVVFDSTIKYDLRFFTSLDRIVQSEPWLERDRAMIDQLRTLGIEKGKRFAPDERTKALIEAGAKEANAWLDAKYDAFFPPFFEGGRWALPADQKFVSEIQSGYADANQYLVDSRGLTYTYGFIGIKRLGSGQFYLMTIKDKDGNPFDGDKTYRLHVPPNVPIEQYWSATAYDRETHALIRNMDRASRGSNSSEVKANGDGSIDIYFGPRAPAGKEANWVPTDPKRQFEVMFRLYRPTKAFFDKQWVLPDIVMKVICTFICVVVALAAAASFALAQTPPSGDAVPVTADNFRRAESDMYFASAVKQADGLGKFHHHREVMRIDDQTVIRANRDTLYSTAVFDLDAGPVTITLPDPGKRFMSMIVIDEDQYAPATVYAPGSFTYSKNEIGTRYLMMGIRTFVDPADPKDIEQAHALQDAITISQAGSGRFEAPNWDQTSQKKGARRADCSRQHNPRHQAHVRTKGSGRPGSAFDWNRHGLGRQCREGRDLPHRRADRQ
ncbi:DUF1254 domain-containing protein [Bradyrhizobium sp. TZ2]